MLTLDLTSKGEASCDAKIKHTKILQKNLSFLGSGEVGFIWLNQKKKKKKIFIAFWKWSRIEIIFSLGKEGGTQNKTHLSKLSPKWSPRPSGTWTRLGTHLLWDLDIATAVQLSWITLLDSFPTCSHIFRDFCVNCRTCVRICLLLWISQDDMRWQGRRRVKFPGNRHGARPLPHPFSLAKWQVRRQQSLVSPHPASASTLPYTQTWKPNTNSTGHWISLPLITFLRGTKCWCSWRLEISDL